MPDDPDPAPTRWVLLLRVVASCCLTLGLLAGPGALDASAEGVATTFGVDATVAKDGTLTVDQTVTFTGTAPPQLSQRFQVRENLLGDRQYVREISQVTATVKGAPVTPSVVSKGSFTTVTVPTGGASDVRLGYTVKGAVVKVDGGTVLRWRLLQGLSAQVGQFSATVQIPGLFSYVACTAGSPNSTTPCSFAAAGTDTTQVPTFRDGPRGEGEVVAVDIGFVPGAVAANERIENRWTFGRAFSAKPLQIGLALGLLALGALALLALHRRAGADAHPAGQVAPVARFVPTGPGETEFQLVDGIRPGHVGTVIDERVDPIDVTATLLDLAVRGHLLITELPRGSGFAATDWVLVRQSVASGSEVGGSAGGDTLRPFEEALLDGIAPPSSEVRVSELAGRVHDSIAVVQDRLYDDVVAQGWYERRPDATRNTWTEVALGVLIIAIAMTGALVAVTTFGLLGLAMVALGLGLVFVAGEMPSRTAKGSAMLAGLGALRSDLLSHPTTQMPPGRELHELSEVLPYAVVLGGADRWLDAIVSSDDDEAADSTDLSWYHGPDGWHLRDLPDSLRNFITTVSGTLFAR